MLANERWEWRRGETLPSLGIELARRDLERGIQSEWRSVGEEHSPDASLRGIAFELLLSGSSLLYIVSKFAFSLSLASSKIPLALTQNNCSSPS